MTVTLLIIIVTAFISFRSFENRAMMDQLKHHPASEANSKEWYRMITSGFVHADYFHLGVNMFVLYAFGETVETEILSYYDEVSGRLIYILMYVAMIIVGCMPSFFKHRNNYHYSAIGASGAVSGILFAYILFHPWKVLQLYFVLPIPAIILGVLYLLYSSWASKKMDDNIGHDAHFYGAIAGLVFTAFLLPDSLVIFLTRFLQGLPF